MNSTALFEWIPRPGEYFHFNGNHFDVAAAKTIITSSPREFKFATLREIRAIKSFPDSYGDSYVQNDLPDAANLSETDLGLPLIAVQYKLQFLVIDGWHRVVKAGQINRSNLPYTMLNDEETGKIAKWFDPKRR